MRITVHYLNRNRVFIVSVGPCVGGYCLLTWEGKRGGHYHQMYWPCTPDMEAMMTTVPDAELHELRLIQYFAKAEFPPEVWRLIVASGKARG